MTKDEIKAELDALGIDYDARMGADKLAALLSHHRKPDGVLCTVLRDFWPTDQDEDRVRKGTVVEVTAEQAMDGIEAGTLKRVR